MAWTKNQQDVLNASGSILVSASAGTGKTAILTEKVAITLINDNIPIENILVVTFSNAAALEMKERIKSRLFEITQSQDQSISMRARYCLNRFSQANIQTIHSFCFDLIKKYAIRYGYSSSVSVIDDASACVLKAEAVSNILEQEYISQNKLFREVERYTAQSGKKIENAVIALASTINSYADPEEWMNKALAKYVVQDGSIPQHIAELIMRIASSANDKLDDAIECLQKCDSPDAETLIRVMEEDRKTLNSLYTCAIMNDSDSINSNLCSSFGKTTIRLSKKLSDSDRLLAERAVSLRDDAKKMLMDFFNKGDFSLNEHLDRIKTMYQTVSKLFQLCRSYSAEYRKLKIKNNVIDFGDMETLAKDILSDNKIALACQTKYRRVFVDEYQDTSPIQEYIISKVASQTNLFCVGDLKQSIYRFRSSDPSLFKRRNKKYSDGSGTVISLNHNFRSAQNVLNCANDVFMNITHSSAEMEYTDNDVLHKGSSRLENTLPTVVDVISSNIKDKLPSYDNNQIEILNVVKNIQNVLGTEIYDKSLGKMRPAEYKDIAVLSRNLSGISASLNDIFTANHIPFKVDNGGSLLNTFEISFLLDILHLCCNIKDDVRIVSMIHSGLFYLNDADLIKIRAYEPEGNIYDNMKSLQQNDLSLGIKCSTFFDTFDKYTKLQEKYSLIDTIKYIIDDINLKDYIIVRRNGVQGIANIDVFLKLVANYQHSCYEKIHRFLSVIETVKDLDVVIPEARTNKNSNCVTITTIHKSKGLEYPIVIIAFAGKEFSGHKNDDIFICDKDNGLGIKYFSYQKQEKGICLNWKEIDDVSYQSSKEEEMRLLYVAMTRAQDQLIIQTTEKKHCLLDDATSYADWVFSSIIENGNIKDALSGNWMLNFTDASALENLATAVQSVDPEDFLTEYNVPASLTLADVPSKEIAIPTPLAMVSSRLDETVTLQIPAFKIPSRTQKGRTAAEKGTLLHKFMQLIDFQKASTKAGFDECIAEMLKNKQLLQEDINDICIDNIRRLLTSDMWKAMIGSADTIEKEKHISTMLKSQNLGSVYINNADIVVNCVVDLVVTRKNGESFIFDYKTDSFNCGGSEEEIAQHQAMHKTQVSVYKEALETCGYNVKGIYAIYTDICKVVPFHSI